MKRLLAVLILLACSVPALAAPPNFGITGFRHAVQQVEFEIEVEENGNGTYSGKVHFNGAVRTWPIYPASSHAQFVQQPKLAGKGGTNVKVIGVPLTRGGQGDIAQRVILLFDVVD